MTKPKQKTRPAPAPQREEQHATLLKEALARPGVRDVLKVYHGWQEQNDMLDFYRSATDAVENIRLSDRANVS